MFCVQDQIGRTVHLTHVPKRIISLVPSQTELLYDLGLNAEIMGITKFCIHPAHWRKEKTIVGGTKQLNLQKIKNLQPDLIIANKEENVKEQIEELEKLFPVWISDVSNLEGALYMITAIGTLTGRQTAAEGLISSISKAFTDLSQQLNGTLYKTCYLIWKQPYMTIGSDTFINDLLFRCGFKNIFSDKVRYPVISSQEILEQDLDIILFSSEPYPFKQKHIEEMAVLYKEENIPAPKMLLADGELFSWYGSRLLHTPEYIKSLHQQLKAL